MPEQSPYAKAVSFACSTVARRFWHAGTPLPDELEAGFQQEMDRVRRHRTQRTGVVAILIYGLFAISDRIMLPDAYLQAWAIRFLLVIPLMAICTAAVLRARSVIVREIALSAMVVIVAASIAWISGLSGHQNAVRYQAGISLVVLFGNIVLGIRFRGAVVSSIIASAIYGAALLQMNTVDAAMRFNSWFVFVAIVVISLIANYRMEQDQRRAYLATAREQERNEELSHAVELLGKLSAEDALTQIANRREFDRRLNIEWGRARREAQPLALILVDVDFFKSYNDHYGHPAGDACLQQIALILKTVPQRSSDLVARLGGEEFGVLLPGTTLADAVHIAERMRSAILAQNIPHAYSIAAPVVSASFGVTAMLPSPEGVEAELLETADAALYGAKKAGRNRVAVHDSELFSKSICNLR